MSNTERPHPQPGRAGRLLPPLDPAIVARIRAKARQLVGKAGMTSSDRPDIEQELTLHLLRRTGHFDPSQSCYAAFAHRVIDQAVASLLEYRRAAGRGRRTQSLNRRRRPDQQPEVGDSGSCDAWEPEDASWPPAERRSDLAMDVRDALDRLPPDLKLLAEELKDKTISAIAGEKGVSRMAIYRDIKRLRTALAAGLPDYFGGRCDSSSPVPVDE